MQPTKELIDQLYREEVLRARQMRVHEKLFAGPELFDMACGLMVAGIRRQFPDANEERIAQLLRQRLAIAQAMLGLPELLLMDEPTNGLDPPQIHAMREVLRRYAATGRTVLVSSHVLSEVEQTVSAGSSGLTYDAASDQYVLTWKTDKAWKGTCRQLTLKFNDGGGTYTASFRFK